MDVRCRRALPLLLGSAVLLAGCRGVGAQGLTHWPVPPPPEPVGRQPQLWVALAARLGDAPLSLRAAAGSLQLRDAYGVRLDGPELELRWGWQPLPQPQLIRRRVLGPFASYEAAEQAALAWGRQGVQAQVAHPGEWEVWGPAAAAPPPGFQARLEEQQLRQRRLVQGRLPLPGSAGAWRQLAGPLQIQAPQGLRWQGGVFAGPFRLQADASDRWTLVEQVPLEQYLLGVVPHEIGAGSPAAALEAQAVLARTWALRNRQRFAVDGYHLCADTQCQVYGDPRQAGAAVRRAVGATAGRVLAWRGEPIHAVYHASNGGVAADEEEAWPLPELPYLEAFLDWSSAGRPPVRLPLGGPQELRQVLSRRLGAYGADHPRFRWRRLIREADLRQAVGARGVALGAPLRPVVLERGASGRVVRLAIAGPGGQEVLVRDAIRRRLRQLPSTLFVLQPAGAGAWWFEGGGFGHGAGLSQAGAIDLGARGWSLERILSHYYPGTTLVPLQQLQGRSSGGP